jgi:hypothetical protein
MAVVCFTPQPRRPAILHVVLQLKYTPQFVKSAADDSSSSLAARRCLAPLAAEADQLGPMCLAPPFSSMLCASPLCCGPFHHPFSCSMQPFSLHCTASCQAALLSSTLSAAVRDVFFPRLHLPLRLSLRYTVPTLSPALHHRSTTFFAKLVSSLLLFVAHGPLRRVHLPRADLRLIPTRSPAKHLIE